MFHRLPWECYIFLLNPWKSLAAFQNGSILPGAEYAQPRLLQHIHKSCRQRIVRSHNDQIHFFFFGKRSNSIKLIHSNGHTFRHLGNPCVPRSTIYFICFRASATATAIACSRAASAYNQNFHLYLTFPSVTLTFPLAIKSIALGRICHSGFFQSHAAEGFPAYHPPAPPRFSAEESALCPSLLHKNAHGSCHLNTPGQRRFMNLKPIKPYAAEGRIKEGWILMIRFL